MLLFWIYNISSYLGLIFIPIVIKIRLFKKKEFASKIKQRYGFATIKRPDNRVAWVHAVSVGEFNSMLPIINNLIEKNIFVVVTTSSFASVVVAEKKLPKGSVHQMFPLDCPVFIKRFLKHWQPEIVIFAESEIWPNIFYYVAKKAKLYIVNCYIPNKAYNFWITYAKSLLIFCLNKCDKIYTDNKEMQNKLTTLLNKKIDFLYHTKYDIIDYNKASNKDIELQNKMQNRTIFLFASTHTGEDKIALDTHNILKQKIPNLLTIIVPRHLNRLGEIKDMIDNLSVAFYSDDSFNNNTEILVVDTIGNLMFFYSLCNIAIVCGSFVSNIGGHNPLEPAILKKPIIMGNYHEVYEHICKEMLEQNAIFICNKDNLYSIIYAIYSNQKIIDTFSLNAYNFVKNRQGSSKIIINQIIQ